MTRQHGTYVTTHPTLLTARLRLRPFTDADADPSSRCTAAPTCCAIGTRGHDANVRTPTPIPPSTTTARGNLNCHGAHFLTAYVAGA
jgi:hypothetical protein